MSCIPLKQLFFFGLYFRRLLPYIMGCRVMVHSREVGGGGRGGGVLRISSDTGMIKGYGLLLSKDFLGFEIFNFGVAWFKKVFFK